MIPVKLKYGEEGFKQIETFLKNNKKNGYRLTIYDNLSKDTVDVCCEPAEMLDVLRFVSSIEKDFPIWIGTNKFTQSYLVNMSFSRGEIPTASTIRWHKDKVIVESDKENREFCR